MKVVDIADEIFRELGEPTTLSIPAITYWIRSNVGQMNNLIHTSFFINSKDLEIVETVDSKSVEIGEEEKAIIKKMYFIHFYDQKLRTHMIAMDTDTVISVRDGDSGVTKINRNEMTRSMASIKAQEYNELQILVGSYKMTKATPIQVAGDDTQSYSYDSTKRNSRNDKFL
tara:strand:- start:2174 stop:2686 length:513 start_codon:yes stop_codon:yes gene_type:complete